MSTLFDLCVAAAREHDLVECSRLPATLMKQHFSSKLDLQYAYTFGNVERVKQCVERCIASGLDPHAAVLACALYGNLKTTLATQHLFPEGCRVYGSLGFDRESPKIYHSLELREPRWFRIERNRRVLCVDMDSDGCARRLHYIGVNIGIDRERKIYGLRELLPVERGAPASDRYNDRHVWYWDVLCWYCARVKSGDRDFACFVCPSCRRAEQTDCPLVTSQFGLYL